MGTFAMTSAVPRSLVEAFYAAFGSRDSKRVAEFLADDVEWTFNGPVDILPFCGTRHGKAAVLDFIDRLVPGVFRVFSFVTTMMLLDGEQVSTLNRLSARSHDGRVITYRVAHFMRFRDGKLIENIALIDSFDAVEQVLGHPLAMRGQREKSGVVVAL
jgi:ketosteroid isomerase-like protein